MTELDQRIALAKLRGMEGPWQQHNIGRFSSSEGFYNQEGQRLPELTLDELHEAEKCLPKQDDAEYVKQLTELCEILRPLGGITVRGAFLLIQATAAQRSEALLRTVGLWREE